MARSREILMYIEVILKESGEVLKPMAGILIKI